ncbi:OB-fold domain-containing protein [Microbacterium sp. X-17]|uniref:OB-fold domain-containing protein n=1 Tax=Microbacterium sp. X-17 TaxID=3144404 RepID=UPI0031F4B775
MSEVLLTVSSEELTPETAPGTVYDRFAQEGVLAYERCTSCDSAIFPPRVLCPVCGGGVLAWEASAGRGRIYSQSTITRRDGSSYTVALIDLDEGFRMMSTVTAAAGAATAIGDEVVVTFDTEDEQALAVFVAAASDTKENTLREARTPAEVYAVFYGAINDGDLEGAVSVYTPETIFVRDGARLDVAELRTRLAAMIDTDPRVRPVDIRVIEFDDHAFTEVDVEVERNGADGARVRTIGTDAHVMRRLEDGSWRVLRGTVVRKGEIVA